MVIRRGLTVRQTALLVAEILEEPDVVRRETLLARRLAGSPPGPRPSRATRSEADWMAADILRIHNR